MIGVLIVDDRSVVRRGLEQLLGSHPEMSVVGTAENGEQAVLLAAELAPDVILMDLSMPVLDGVQATKQITAASPDISVVVLTSFSDQRRILDALAAGAAGYILKDADPDELINAVPAAAKGGSPLHPKAARVLLDARREETSGRRLSAREEEVLRAVVEGLPNKRIARRLGITERTVKAHLTRVFQQLGVADRTQAALWARANLPDVDPS